MGKLTAQVHRTKGSRPTCFRALEGRGRSAFAVAGLIVAMLGLTSCQRALDVAVANNCDLPIEVTVDDVREGTDSWVPVPVGRVEYAGSVSELATHLYIKVRMEQSGPVSEFSLPIDEAADSDGEFDLVVAVEDDQCSPGKQGGV